MTENVDMLKVQMNGPQLETESPTTGCFASELDVFCYMTRVLVVCRVKHCHYVSVASDRQFIPRHFLILQKRSRPHSVSDYEQ